jgi:hypothetical protein
MCEHSILLFIIIIIIIISLSLSLLLLLIHTAIILSIALMLCRYPPVASWISSAGP